ncbi:fimbria/pilus periplasmic chaperone [Immundisolibacter sp.]|uniref:fimbrial biogenesis chaperone n=1 Tax=Immundisolibacter sp. TaxID=1934948 RepID=UPI00262E73CE|nr:fimbria/pilus periplasmic chaperone [Immundisolibacter sp.]MDD3651955.1 fimbria/pilus periplasmic chaperone [Immundisolibacter sp.]
MFAGLAAAAQLRLAPIKVHMAPGQRAAALTVTNEGSEPAAFQIRAYAWRQTSEGADDLAPTEELLVSPPLSRLEAGAQQVVRLVLRRPPTEREATYRILFDEIPPPAAPNTVRIVVRQSVPVFAPPKAKVAARLAWRIEQGADGAAWLVALNQGSRHAEVREVALATADGAALAVEPPALPYVLTGATRRWRIKAPAPAAGQELRLTARVDAATLEERVIVGNGTVP